MPRQAAFVSLFNAAWRSALSITGHYQEYGAQLDGRRGARLITANEEELARCAARLLV